MAVVAFRPFTTCIASEDIEDESALASFGGLSTTTSRSHQTTTMPQDAMSDIDGTEEASTGTAPDSDTESVPSLAASGPTGEPVLQDESEDNDAMIDDAFFEELNDNDDGGENDGGNDNGNDDARNVVEEPTAVSSAHDSDINTTRADFGGLGNLGNTCYLNSALQMVASLDSFAAHLQRNPLPANGRDDDDSEQSKKKGLLRLAFLEVMESLSKGETVRPTEFKRLLDERTPLFVGFRQQDSHEFLTTLFDLLDEDYKVKPVKKIANQNDEQQTTKEASPDDDADCAQEKDESHDSQALSNDMEVEEAKEESHDSDDPMEEKGEEELESYESAAKKPRNVELGESSTTEESHVTPKANAQPFSNLRPDGIEKLLHANLLVDQHSEDAAAPPTTPPRCKLVGGRMASADMNDHEMLISENDVSTTSMCMACDSSESEDAACSSLSPVESYLKTEVRVRLTCDSCKYTRAHTENFFHLSLEIGSDNSSVAEGLRKFFSPEQREVKCEKCFCNSALQTMQITRLPRALLLHFKRFIVDINDDYTSITYRKNQSDVLFEDKLELEEERGGVLAEFVAEDVSMPHRDESHPGVDDGNRTYQIRSVVNHIGSSAACGHYTADATRVYPGGEREWARFNDSYVSRISPNEAMKESARTAYMVMYEIV